MASCHPSAHLSISTDQSSPWGSSSRCPTSTACFGLDLATISRGFAPPYLCFSALMCWVIARAQLLTFSRSVKFLLHI